MMRPPTAARSALPARCAPTPRFTKPRPNQRKPSLTRTIRPALPAHCPFRAYLVSPRSAVIDRSRTACRHNVGDPGVKTPLRSARRDAPWFPAVAREPPAGCLRVPWRSVSGTRTVVLSLSGQAGPSGGAEANATWCAYRCATEHKHNLAGPAPRHPAARRPARPTLGTPPPWAVRQGDDDIIGGTRPQRPVEARQISRELGTPSLAGSTADVRRSGSCPMRS